MKSKKIKAISLTLASALVSAGLGGALLAKNAVSADEAANYALGDLFVGTNATIAAKSIGEGDSVNNVTSFALKKGTDAKVKDTDGSVADGKVQLKNSVALKWFAEEGEDNAKTVQEKYFSTTLLSGVK